MMSPNQRSALAALDVARPIVVRLDPSRHPEDLAADLIESWSAVETALRSLVGGSALAGQALVGELRQRELLSINQAHALLEYLAARDRAGRTEYRPTAGDIAAARTGFQTLEAALGVGVGAHTATYPAIGMPPAAGDVYPNTAERAPVAAYDAGVTRARTARGRGLPRWALPLAAVVLLAAAAGGWMLWGGAAAGGMQACADAYGSGRRESARQACAEAAREEPERALPHVYLARLAREDGDVSTATRELTTAITLEPKNGVAQREMGNLLLVSNRPDRARPFYVRAIEADTSDRAAMGWLGCALARQGDPQNAATWFQRAGNGDWTACQRATAGVGLPPGAPQPVPGAPMTAPAPGAAPYR
jgi:tetratricopeptide (TPR) repeat protein